MTTTTFVRVALALALLALAACGGDGKKTRQSCDVDSDCTGGVCFEQQCYTACTDQGTCADDEFCVAKPRGDDTVSLCVVAADFVPCGATDDCAALVPGQCQASQCLPGGLCGFEGVPDGEFCETAAGPGTCTTDGCLLLPEEDCGDRVCEGQERCETCPEDCSGCSDVVSDPCGDGSCAADEDCVSCPGDCAGCVEGYLWTFDDGMRAGFSTEITADPWMGPMQVEVVEGGPSFLGAFGKQSVSLTVGSTGTFAVLPGFPAPLPTGPLPAHDTVRLTFDLLVLGSWDGHAATTGSTFPSMPDLFTYAVPAVDEGHSFSLANCVEDVQSYPDDHTAGIPNPTNAAKFGAVSSAPIVTVDGCGDAIYRVTATFGHTADTLEVLFLANLNEYPGSTNLANESWGLDNVKVELLCEACGG